MKCGRCHHPQSQHGDGVCFKVGCRCRAFIPWSEATPLQRATAQFGETFWTLYSKRAAFRSGAAACEVEGCDALCSRRIMCNIWGTIAEYDCCSGHAQYFDGKRLDDFPIKRSLQREPPQLGLLTLLDEAMSREGG